MSTLRNPNISQDAILKKFSIFLTLQNTQPNWNGKKTVLPDMVAKSGHCMGFTVLACYAKWLELTQPVTIDKQGKTIQRDDWPTIERLFHKISTWNEKFSKGNTKLIKQMSRLISLVAFLQNAELYIPTSSYNFIDLLEDTKRRPFRREFSIAGLLKQSDFTNEIEINNIKTTFFDAVVKEDRIVFMLVDFHIFGFIRHANQIYFYDSNYSSGWVTYSCSNLVEMIAALFKICRYQMDKPYGFRFYCVTSDDFPEEIYFAQSELLATLPPYIISSDGEKTTALHLAMEIHCAASVDYYLKNPPIPLNEYLFIEDYDHSASLIEAADSGFIYAVKNLLATQEVTYPEEITSLALAKALDRGYAKVPEMLLGYGANINFIWGKVTPLINAALNDNRVVMEFLLQRGAKPNIKCEGVTALHICAQQGNLPAVMLLVKYSANVNLQANDEETALSLAVDEGHDAVVDFLLKLPQLRLRVKDYICLERSEPAKNPLKYKRRLHLAELNILLQQVKIQLNHLKHNFNKYYVSHAEPVFNHTMIQMKNPLLNSRCRTLLLLQNMLPVFNHHLQKHDPTLWEQYKDLKAPLIKLIQYFKISQLDINHAQSMITQSISLRSK